MTEPLISVIIPMYNAEYCLSQCLDSLRAQTYPFWEAVIWDDGSVDESRDIALIYGQHDPRFVLVGGGSRCGVTRTLAKGIRTAIAPYIAVLDADDWLEPTCLEKCITPFLDGWEVGMIYTDYFIEDMCGEVKVQKTVQNPDPTSRHYSHSFSDRLLLEQLYIRGFRLFQRSAYRQTSGIELSLPAAADYDLTLKLSEIANFARISEPLYHYRVHPLQQSVMNPDAYIVSTKAAAEQAIVRRKLTDKLETYLSWTIRKRQ